MTDQLSSDLASLRIHRDAPEPPSALKRLIVPVLLVTAVGTAGYFAYQRFASEIFKQEVRTTEIAMISPSFTT